jgi:hypothetical protein
MDANRPDAGGNVPPDAIVGAHGVSAEKDLVSTPIVIGLYGVLVGLSIFAAVVVGVLFFALEKRADKRDTAAIAEAGLERPQPDKIPPAPRLEIHTVGRWRTFREAEQARLSSYGWMDRGTGAVHIPIERAMDLIAERGVGPLPPAPVVMPAGAAGQAPPPSAGQQPERKQ